MNIIFGSTILRDILKRARFPLAAILMGAALSGGPARAQYTLMRGGLHSHTMYSDSLFTIDTFRPSAAANQAFLNTLDVFATTDHGEYLSDQEWANTIADLTGATTPGKTIALWGFEWTASKDGFPLTSTGLGHINVFGSERRSGMLNNSGTSPTLTADWVSRLWWKNQGATVSNDGTLYQWMLNNGVSPRGGTIVGQFNHPSGMPGVSLANPSSRITEGETITIADWWRKLEWVEPLDPYMTLMELGARGVTLQLQPIQHNLPWNEPYFQLALDNGWHIAPTNSEDNHNDAYGQDIAPAPDAPPLKHRLLVATGIWMEPTAGLTPQQAQGKLLAALRERRTFSAEYKPGSHKDGASLKFTVNTVADGVKWMGDRTLKPQDLAGSRCRLEVKPGKGLTLNKVEVVTNRGVVARSLPVSGAGVTITNGVASWEFGLSGDSPGAQIRACSDTFYATNAYANPPLPPTWAGSSRGVVLHAAASAHIERYYYVRVTQQDSEGYPYYLVGAPVWVQRAKKTPVSYHWEFGDGTADQAVTVPASPAPDTVYGEVRHTYPASGTVYHPRVTVTYSDGSRDSAIGRVGFGTAPTTPLYGDVNGDGQINREDVALLSRAIAGLQGITTSDPFQRANVFPPAAGGAPGGTTYLDISDMLRLSRFLAGTLHANRAVPVWP